MGACWKSYGAGGVRDAVAAPRGCSLGVVWMGPREAASMEIAAPRALRSRLAVVLPPSGRCACARGIRGLAYATRKYPSSSFSRSRRAQSVRVAMPCETGLACATYLYSCGAKIDRFDRFFTCEIAKRRWPGRGHYSCCTAAAAPHCC